MNKKRAYFKYIISLLLFGSNGFVVSFIHLTSYEIVLLRSVLGAAALVALYFLTGQKLTCFRHRKDCFYVALSGLAMAADWLFLFEAYQRIGVSLGILINYFGPAIVIALSPLVLGEKVERRKVLALIAAFIGVVLISGSAAIAGLNLWGLACAVLSAFSYAVLVLADKKSEEITGMENAMVQLFFTAVGVVLFMACKQGFAIPIARSEVFPIVWLGIVNTGLGCYAYFSSIGDISAQSVGVLGYLEPLSGVVLAAALLGESMSAVQILGAACIIGGALYGENLLARRRRS